MNCWQNNAYSLCNGSEPNHLFLSDRFRHLCKRFFSHRPLNIISCFHIQLLTVLLQYFFAICHCRSKVDLFVMLMYYTKVRPNMWALVRRSAVLIVSVLLESSVIPSYSIQSKPIKDLLSLSSPKISIVFALRKFLCLSVFSPSKSSADFPMTARNFEAKKSAGVSVPISHFFPSF